VAAKYGVGLALILLPPQRRMACHLLMALVTGIKRVAALESDRNEVAVRVVMRALSTLINPGAAYNHLTGKREATPGCRGKHARVRSIGVVDFIDWLEHHERLTSGRRHSFGLRSLFDLLEGRISVADPIMRFVNFGRIDWDRARNRLGSRDQLAFKLYGFRALDWKFPVMREFVDGVKHGLGLDAVHPASTHRVVEHPVAILPWPVFLLVSGIVQH